MDQATVTLAELNNSSKTSSDNVASRGVEKKKMFLNPAAIRARNPSSAASAIGGESRSTRPKGVPALLTSGAVSALVALSDVGSDTCSFFAAATAAIKLWRACVFLDGGGDGTGCDAISWVASITASNSRNSSRCSAGYDAKIAPMGSPAILRSIAADKISSRFEL